MPAYQLSDPVIAAFVLIPIALAATLVWATLVAWRRSGAPESAARRAAIIVAIDSAAWMTLTWAAAVSGILQQWDRRPPPFLLVILGMVAISLILAFGRVGTRIAQHIPLWALVAIQGFRLPLELAMHFIVELLRDIRRRGLVVEGGQRQRVDVRRQSPAGPSPHVLADNQSFDTRQGRCSAVIKRHSPADHFGINR